MRSLKTKQVICVVAVLGVLIGMALAQGKGRGTDRQLSLDPSHLVGIYAPPDSMAARDNVLNFQLPPDIDLQLVIDQVQAQPPDTFIWTGYLPDKPGSQVTLIAEKFVLAGFFQLETGSFEIRYLDRRRPKPGARATNFVYPLKVGEGFKIILPEEAPAVQAPPGLTAENAVEVYVVLKGEHLSWEDPVTRCAQVAELQDNVIAAVAETGMDIRQRFTYLPILVGNLTEAGYAVLAKMPEVQTIEKLPPIEAVEGVDLGQSPADLPAVRRN